MAWISMKKCSIIIMITLRAIRWATKAASRKEIGKD